jgi:hypothetical protein
MEAKEKLPMLLAEYNTLRQEVIAARTSVAQGAGIFSAAIIGAILFGFSSGRSNPEFAIMIGIVAVVYICALVVWNEKVTTSLTRRLRELESEMNGIAGERVMLWETIHGWGNLFFNSNPNFRGYTTPEEPLAIDQLAPKKPER